MSADLDPQLSISAPAGRAARSLVGAHVARPARTEDPACGDCRHFIEDDCRHEDWADFPAGATKAGDPFCSCFEVAP